VTKQMEGGLEALPRSDGSRTDEAGSAEAAIVAIVETIKSHPSFRSCVYQVERGAENCHPVLRLRIQFWRCLRINQVKSGCMMAEGSSQCFGSCVWSADSRGAGQPRTSSSLLDAFKNSGTPEAILEKFSLPGANRILGPWSQCQEGLPELIEILETADQPEKPTLSEREAKVQLQIN
jgi:hypothetical protein